LQNEKDTCFKTIPTRLSLYIELMKHFQFYNQLKADKTPFFKTVLFEEKNQIIGL